jgi:hypothetical protein
VKELADRLGAGAVGADPVDVGALGHEQFSHLAQARTICPLSSGRP